MKLYIYDVENDEIVAIAEGNTNQECEEKALIYTGTDEYGASYSLQDLTLTEDTKIL